MEQKRFCHLPRRLRKEAGLTQVELARLLNTPHSRISDYERGERRIDMLQLAEYLKPLDVTLEEFVRRFNEDTFDGDAHPETLDGT